MSTLKVALVACISLFACNKGYVGQSCPAQSNDISTEGNGNGCAAPTYFRGTVPAGGACEDSRDCAPICCACASSGGAALAARCTAGTCDTPDQVCCSFNTWSAICKRGPSSPYFKSCDSDGDCATGLSCIRRYQLTMTSSATGPVCDDPYQQKICTKRCTANSECEAYSGACTGQDACNGAKNLCYDK